MRHGRRLTALVTPISYPYPPCINSLERPIPQLGAINQFESAATSVYNGMTVAVRKRTSGGLYFNLAYTCVGSGNSEPLIPEILSRSALEGEASSKFR